MCRMARSMLHSLVLLVIFRSCLAIELLAAFGAIQGGIDAAQSLGAKCTVAIYDSYISGTRALLRMDGAPPATVELAIGE